MASEALINPAAYAAATSPEEWPTMALNWIPAIRRRWISKICTAAESGCATVASLMRDDALSDCSSFMIVHCGRSPSGNVANDWSSSSITWRATLKDASSFEPIAAHWAPCPVRMPRMDEGPWEELAPRGEPGLAAASCSRSSILSHSCSNVVAEKATLTGRADLRKFSV